ncbi:MAG: flagellar motor protein [Cyanobacteria bacterium]|nr:flagellar motor protein [Cyanobacteria bacterium bin.51]
MGYTDLLSTSLLILLLTVAVSSLARARNEKAPLLPLTEAESFRFDSGSYLLSQEFKVALQKRLPEINQIIAKYQVDTVEVIGHTDGQPSGNVSNLDGRLPKVGGQAMLSGFLAGSNADLGLLRAISVSNYLRGVLKPTGPTLTIRPYSAGSLIDTTGLYAPADTKGRAERRRIEVRFTRQENN